MAEKVRKLWQNLNHARVRKRNMKPKCIFFLPFDRCYIIFPFYLNIIYIFSIIYRLRRWFLKVISDLHVKRCKLVIFCQIMMELRDLYVHRAFRKSFKLAVSPLLIVKWKTGIFFFDIFRVFIKTQRKSFSWLDFTQKHQIL